MTDNILSAEKLAAQQLSVFLEQKGLTISCAESATCGMIAKLLTDRAGSSAWFWGGVASYANEAKARILGVSEELLADPERGPITAECACQMADGMRRISGTDLSVSVTGIAGPSGAEPGKPVGTVFLGFSSKTRPTQAVRLCIESSDREDCRSRFAAACLTLALKYAKGETIIDIVSF